MILTGAAFLGVPAAVYDTIQRFHSIDTGLPPWASPYLPVIYLTAFVIGLVVLGTAPEDQDFGSLHEANTRLQNTVASQHEQINSQQAEIARLRDDAEATQQWQGEVEERFAKAREMLKELQPRRLSSTEREILVRHLAAATSFWLDPGRVLRVVVVAMNCNDCAVYAGDFEAVFTSAGFAITDQTSLPYRPSFETDPNEPDDVSQGITIRYDPTYFENVIPEAKYVDALASGLREAGITFRVLEREFSSFTLIVGEG